MLSEDERQPSLQPQLAERLVLLRSTLIEVPCAALHAMQMDDGEELTAVPNSNSSDRLQQARELGPLFATVFGKDASAAAQEDGLPPI